MLKGQVAIHIADAVHLRRGIVMNIVLVGGGKAAVILLNFFNAKPAACAMDAAGNLGRH